jgi:hypothetical protein
MQMKHRAQTGREVQSDFDYKIWKGICKKNNFYTDSIINNRVSEITKHFTMESLILAQDER